MAPSPTSHGSRAPALLLLAGGVVVGAVGVGAYALLSLRHTKEAARAHEIAARAELEVSQRRLDDLRARSFAPEPTVEATHEAPDAERGEVEGWWSQALQAMAREGLARGWAEVRQDEMPAALEAEGLGRFRAEVEALAPRIGRELAERRGHEEFVEAGIEAAGVFTFLELLDQDAIGPFPDLVEDGERFGALFACAVAGPTVSGGEGLSAAVARGEVVDGTLIRFGPGAARFLNLGPLPRCLTIEGAGMDKTLLVFNALHDYKRVEQLAIRDCTLLASGVDVLDFRGKGSVAIFERVRVIGFDAGAGSSNALSLDQTAFLARDCRFEGGYGRDPGDGCLFDVRTSALLARFERCRFDAMELELQRIRGKATIVFSDCSMTDLRDRIDPRTVEHPGIRFVRCNVSMATPDPERVWARDLNELFPGWQQAR